MDDKRGIIEALRSALAAAPDDLALKKHLAGVLADAHDHDEALKLYLSALQANPTDLEALRGAEKSADVLDDPRAGDYRRLIDALDPAASKPPNDESPDKHVEAQATERVPGAVASFHGPGLRVVGGTEKPKDSPAVENATLKLSEVAGLEAVKRRLHLAFLGPLQNPAMARAYGKKLRGGLLLYGPPGCGKTYIARALAGELGANFMAVGLNDVLNMWLGESERQLHELFEEARANSPTVIFFDELDALGRKRSDLTHSGVREVVNQLLQELDGINGHDEAVFVLGATNLPWDVDTALKRPGRFDRAIFVEPPDLPAREHILELNLKDRPIEKLDLRSVAKKCQRYSGADIAFICELATEKSLEKAMESGKIVAISTRDLLNAAKDVRPSIAAWFETARNYAIFANASGEYSDLAEYIEKNRV